MDPPTNCSSKFLPKMFFKKIVLPQINNEVLSNHTEPLKSVAVAIELKIKNKTTLRSSGLCRTHPPMCIQFPNLTSFAATSLGFRPLTFFSNDFQGLNFSWFGRSNFSSVQNSVLVTSTAKKSYKKAVKGMCVSSVS